MYNLKVYKILIFKILPVLGFLIDQLGIDHGFIKYLIKKIIKFEPLRIIGFTSSTVDPYQI